MPSDIIGVHVFDTAKREFEFRPGPLFADMLLVDEINRAESQNAVGAARGDGGAAGVGRTQNLSRCQPNFLVIATQNPGDFEGTYPLPESQLDRFMLRIDMTYPAREDEQAILAHYAPLNAPRPAALDRWRRQRLSRPREPASTRCIWRRNCWATFSTSRIASRQHAHLSLGMSTRGVLAVLRAARIAAALRGATFVAPDDVKTCCRR